MAGHGRPSLVRSGAVHPLAQPLPCGAGGRRGGLSPNAPIRRYSSKRSAAGPVESVGWVLDWFVPAPFIVTGAVCEEQWSVWGLATKIRHIRGQKRP